MPQVQDWIAQSYSTNSLPLNASRVVNMFAEQEVPDAKSKAPVGIFMHPGSAPFASCGTGPIIAFTTMFGFVFAVTTDSLYQIFPNGGAAFLGHTSVSPNGCSIDNNGTTICWVDGITGWTFNTTSGVHHITDRNFFPSNTVTYFDTYFVFHRKGTQQFFISPPQWNGTDPLLGPDTVNPGYNFTTKDTTSDLVVGIVNNHQQLFVCGERRIEVWYDAANPVPQFPFSRSSGAIVQRGLMAPYTLVLEDNTLFFLGDDLMFYRLNGFVPERRSNHAIETQWAKYSGHQFARAFSYTVMGHKMIAITFPAAHATWVLDLATNRWHERESWTGDNHDTSIGRWRVNCALNSSSSIEQYPEVLFGDSLSGRVDQLNNNVFTEFGTTMRALIVGPPIHSDRRRVFLKKFELDIESGTGEPYDTVGHPGVPGGFFMLPGGDTGFGYGISADGHTVVGAVGSPGTACYWTGLTGPTMVGPTVIGPPGSTAWDVSGDGSVIVGETASGGFYWTAAGGLVTFAGGSANAISADGSIIGGSVPGGGSVPQPVYWDRATLTLTYLPLPVGYIGGVVRSISDNGIYVVGDFFPGPGLQHGFRWTAADGMVDLGLLPGEEKSTGQGVSNDGKVVGYFTQAAGGDLSYQRIFFWTPSTGLTTPIDPALVWGANAIFADGNTILGYSWYPDADTATIEHMGYAVFNAPVIPTPTLHPGSEGTTFYDTNPNAISSDGRVMAGYSGGAWIYYVPVPETVSAVDSPKANPMWRLNVSDDGGRTWSTLVKPRRIGGTGEYLTRLRWLKMGQSRERIIKLECTDPVRRNIIGVYIDDSQGMI